jgi:arylsulfatase
MRGERLNVLLVVIEGARPDHLSCAGYERETTPLLDRIAHEGVRFSQAFTTAPSSLAAHASMLSGLFPSLHGATDEAPVLGPGFRLLPEVLKAAGYRTAAFCPLPSISPANGFGRGFDRFHAQGRGGRLTGRAADYARRASDRVLGRRDAGARRSSEALLGWIDAARGPFFALVHYRESANPHRPPAPYDRTFMPAALTGRGASAHSDADTARAALHDGALRYVDLRIKQIVDGLKASGRWEQTLFVCTASYGEDLGDLGGSGMMTDRHLRVPLILRCPGRIPAGFVVEEFAQPVDLLPTIAALTGSALEVAVQGRALLGESGVTAGPRKVIAEAFRSPLGAAAPATGGGATLDVRRKAIRTRREKFVWRSDEANAVYDLMRDPLERHNLIAEAPERGDGLRRELFDWLAESERWATDHGLPRVDSAWPALERQRAGR